jgi:hypothetical protein
VAGNEDNRHAHIGFRQLALEVEPAYPGQPDIEDETAWTVWVLAAQKVLCGPEQFSPQANRGQQVRDGLTNAGIVIDNKNCRGSFTQRS